MIMHINHKSKVVFYDWNDLDSMYFRQCADKRLRQRIFDKMEKAEPWRYVTINGREMIDEAEKNRILAAFYEAKAEARNEIDQQHNDYMARNHPEINPKYWKLY